MLTRNIAYAFVHLPWVVVGMVVQDAICVWWFMNEISSWEEEKKNLKENHPLAIQFGSWLIALNNHFNQRRGYYAQIDENVREDHGYM